MKLTSLKLSKLLYEKGFVRISSYCCENIKTHEKENEWKFVEIKDCNPTHDSIFAYDLLWDICIKYGKELFGEEMVEFSCSKGVPGLLMFKSRAVTLSIVSALSDNRQEEAEQYIIKNLII